MNDDKSQTTVQVPLKRFKKLEKIEKAFKNGEPIAFISNKYDFEIYDVAENRFYFNEKDDWNKNYTIGSWLRDLISREVKSRYKEDKPSISKQIYNFITLSLSNNN